MRLVDPFVASALSKETGSAWVQVASGQSSPQLKERLGHPFVGDFLPGLGELTGWGVMDEERGLTGAIYTGFHPNPTSVVFLLSARVVHGNRLACEVLDALALLPGGVLNKLQLVSLLGSGPAVRVLDREMPVVDTRSNKAAAKAQVLASHFAIGAAVSTVQVDDAGDAAMLVTVEREWISGVRSAHRPITSLKPGWIEVVDWE